MTAAKGGGGGPLRLTSSQILTVIALCLGYAGYYLCRSDLSVISTALLEDPGANLNKDSLGLVTSIAVYAYAVGKVLSGLAVDMLGGRRLFLVGMLGSIGCTLALGFGSGVTFFVAVWAVNRFYQSTGWSALVKVATNWFNHHQYGRIMGMLSLSFLFGDALGRLYLGYLLKCGWSWQKVLLAAALTLALICLFCYCTVRDVPREDQVGAVPPEDNPLNLFTGKEQGLEGRPGAWALLKPFLTSEAFWCVAVMCFGYTLIRESFNFWLPEYLKEIAGMSKGEAAQWSSLFPLFGGFSVLLCGWLSDHPLKGQRGLIMAGSSAGLTLSLLVMGMLHPGQSQLPLTMVCVVALLLLGPYCFLGGAIAMDLGGKRGAATAAGLVDSAGYFGGALSGAGGAIATRWGWEGAFTALSALSCMTCIAAIIYWKRHEA